MMLIIELVFYNYLFVAIANDCRDNTICLELPSPPKTHRRIVIKLPEQHAKQTESSTKSKRGRQTSQSVKLETTTPTHSKPRVFATSTTVEENMNPKQSKRRRTRGRGGNDNNNNNNNLSEDFSATNVVDSNRKTKKPNKPNKRVGRLSENLLNNIDMTGTLRSEWKIVERNGNRVSLAVTDSPLWKFDGMRSVLSRLV